MKELISALLFVTAFTAPAQAQETKGQIAVFGDENANGPFRHEFRIQAALDRFECDFKYENGSTAKGWAKGHSIRRWMEEYDPQTVVVILGMGEAMSKTPPMELAAEFTALAERIRHGHDRRIIWAMFPIVKDAKESQLDAVRKAIASIPRVELLDYSKEEYGLRYGKPDRLTKAAARALAADVWKKIRPSLMSPPAPVAQGQ